MLSTLLTVLLLSPLRQLPTVFREALVEGQRNSGAGNRADGVGAPHRELATVAAVVVATSVSIATCAIDAAAVAVAAVIADGATRTCRDDVA